MPRSRATEIPQRQSPRGPPSLRTSSSGSDPIHPRPRTERSPKLAEGRSPRGAQSEPSNKKKLGTRIADLESQLGLAQEELKSLKNQLVSTVAAKTSAQDHLEKKPNKQEKASEAIMETDQEKQTLTKKDSTKTYLDDIQQETDVFEVPVEKEYVEARVEPELPPEEDDFNPKSDVSLATSEPENQLIAELALKDDEINLLKTNLDDKDRELEALRRENESLKIQLDEKSLKVSSAESKVDELTLRLDEAGQELEKSKTLAAQINEKLEASEKAKVELEDEMKRLRVQTEQWRKAADAAATVLAGGMEMNGRRVSERCGSMDKLYGNTFEHVYDGYVGSPGLGDDTDEKRKGSGMRMFGDLWKKKGQK